MYHRICVSVREPMRYSFVVYSNSHIREKCILIAVNCRNVLPCIVSSLCSLALPIVDLVKTLFPQAGNEMSKFNLDADRQCLDITEWDGGRQAKALLHHNGFTSSQAHCGRDSVLL